MGKKMSSRLIYGQMIVGRGSRQSAASRITRKAFPAMQIWSLERLRTALHTPQFLASNARLRTRQCKGSTREAQRPMATDSQHPILVGIYASLTLGEKPVIRFWEHLVITPRSVPHAYLSCVCLSVLVSLAHHVDQT